MRLRIARVDDAPAMLAIYAPFVHNSTVSLEYEVPGVSEFEGRITSCLATHPWLVYEDEGLVGYAYAGPHRHRKGYQYCCEVSVYIASGYRGKGIGRTLYRALFDILRLQGYQNAYAGIGGSNAASEAMHQAMGFTLVGVYRNIGYKFGEWSDVSWWELALGQHPQEPPPIIAFRDLPPESIKPVLQENGPSR